MKIAIDLDGVVIDLVAELLPFLSKEAGRAVKPYHITQFDIGAALGLDREQMERVWALADRENVYGSAQPIPGAIDGLRALAHHDLWFVTSRPEKLRGETETWLSRQGLVVEKLLHRMDGQKVTSQDSFGLLIEDKVEALVIHTSLIRYGLLLDQPWNQVANLPENVLRVCSWKEIESFVQKSVK